MDNKRTMNYYIYTYIYGWKWRNIPVDFSDVVYIGQYTGIRLRRR